MKKLLFILILIVSHRGYTQVKISGLVTDTKGRPLIGASIVLKDSYDGATSDSLGNFRFFTFEKGEKELEVTFFGYRAVLKKILIAKDPVSSIFSLKEQVTDLKAVVISAGSFEASDKNRGAVLNALDIVTTPGANGDVTGAFKSLPGTQQVGESEGLFVRGGTATESKIYMDGNLVNNFFYSSTPGIATRGRFNPFLFKGTIFSTGGYSALYGQALSSALILESKDLSEKTEADIAVSLLGVGGGIQKLSKNKRSSWGVSYNYANLLLAFNVIKQKQDFFQMPEYHEGDANFRIKTKKGGFIKYYGYISTNKTGFRSNDIDSSALKNAFSIQNLNTYQNINWKGNLGRMWKINTGLSFSTNKDDILNETQDKNDNHQIIITDPLFLAYKNFSLKTNSVYTQARFVFEKKLKGLSAIRVGSDYFTSNEKSTYTLYNGGRYSENIKERLFAAFVETDIYVNNNLAAKIGTRAEHSENLNKWNIAPRVSLAYKFNNGSQASFAYGIFYQNPERKYLPSTVDLTYLKSDHYILQYLKHTKDYTFRTEIFYKKYQHLLTTNVNVFGQEVAAGNDGSGFAQGAEIFWRDRKSLKNFDYWVSYSYLDTKRKFLNYPVLMQPAFATKHTASLVVKHFVLPWKTEFNASYNFATGRPYYQIGYDNVLNKYHVNDQGKTINYNSLSFSINYLPNMGKKNKKSFVVWVLNVTNVLGQKQIFSYNYNYSGTRKEPVTAPGKRFVYIGCFISFGIDRTQDAINNNL